MVEIELPQRQALPETGFRKDMGVDFLDLKTG
jgi:hypothetical protein